MAKDAVQKAPDPSCSCMLQVVLDIDRFEAIQYINMYKKAMNSMNNHVCICRSVVGSVRMISHVLTPQS